MSIRLLGLDIGGTKSAALVGTEQGQVLARQQWPSQATRGPQAMIAQLVEQASLLLKQYPDVVRVGVSIGGPLDSRAGVIHSPPNLPGWDAIPLADRLSRSLERPVKVEHDAAACALAEATWGVGQSFGDQPTLLYLTCGTGFGAGLVLAGRAWYGRGGRSPEVGHIRLAEQGPTAFGQIGSAEAFCAGASLPKIAAWKYPGRWSDRPPDGRQLKELWDQGDADATEVISLNARMTGRVCAMLADSLMPDVIVLGSLARYLGDGWLTLVRRTYENESLSDASGGRAPVVASALGTRLQDLSALAAAMGQAVTATESDQRTA